MLLQLLSTLTGYIIHNYVDLNVGSERLISQLQGYEYVSQKNTPQLQSANHLNLRRFEHLIESFQNTVKQIRFKIYHPGEIYEEEFSGMRQDAVRIIELTSLPSVQR
jgi:hypothetical protein